MNMIHINSYVMQHFIKKDKCDVFPLDTAQDLKDHLEQKQDSVIMKL